MEKQFEKGKETGFNEGKETGFKEGKETGVGEGIEKVARNLKAAGIVLEVIMQTTGLSREEIERLKP